MCRRQLQPYGWPQGVHLLLSLAAALQRLSGGGIALRTAGGIVMFNATVTVSFAGDNTTVIV